jgi:predicted N-acyltransferase
MDRSVTIRVVDAMCKIAAADWDACAGTNDPFVSHAFLLALEESGSANADTGWAPHHLVAEDGRGGVLGCAPLYLKGHSYGEYVFDWGWAEAWQRNGRDYYPKLQCAVPFTPVTGRRLLVPAGSAGAGIEDALAEAMSRLCDQAGLSSAHMTFPTEAEANQLAACGWLLRIGEQYHWRNRGYKSFADFLGALNSRKRKAIRKEREQILAQGLDIQTLTGAALTPRHWNAFYAFYRNTTDRKWGQAYLTRDFFRLLGEYLADRVVLIVAEKNGEIVAGALNLLGTDTLYGRNWGSIGEYRFLHFELCYYRAIDFAIERGLAKVEAGAQGEHKISRGYEPVPTYSAHWIREQPFRKAVAQFLERERAAIEADIRARAEAGPYRADSD